MTRGRLEAFSDGVIAIIITIMVLDLKAPPHSDLIALQPLIPVFFSYLLSFVYVGIYWNNHHHLFQTVQSVNGRILWANLHLLFWLSLIPFVTGWAGGNNFAPWPVAMYGLVLLMAGFAFMVLVRTLISHHGPQSLVATVQQNIKTNLSLALYAAAIPLAFLNAGISCAIYVGVALLWLKPDPRVEDL